MRRQHRFTVTIGFDKDSDATQRNAIGLMLARIAQSGLIPAWPSLVRAKAPSHDAIQYSMEGVSP